MRFLCLQPRGISGDSSSLTILVSLPNKMRSDKGAPRLIPAADRCIWLPLLEVDIEQVWLALRS